MTDEGGRLRWGILATGHIAGVFAEGVARSRHGRLVAVASRTATAAEAFAEARGIPNWHEGYEALLDDREVDAVYIATPHPLHAEWAVRAAAAGKHVLCEKPIAMDAGQASGVIDAARANDVFLMEAYMYRCAPQTAKLVELVRGGAIGEPLSIEASFSFAAGTGADGRHFSRDLGGGGILDLGCYPMSMARLLAGVATGEPYAEPDRLKAVGHIGSTGVDEYSSAVVEFPGGVVARLSCGIVLEEPVAVSVAGSEGRIHVPVPWKPSPHGGVSELHLYGRGRSGPEVIEVASEEYIFSIEADTVARHLAERQAPAVSWGDTLGNMRALDRWRDEIGLCYGAG